MLFNKVMDWLPAHREDLLVVVHNVIGIGLVLAGAHVADREPLWFSLGLFGSGVILLLLDTLTKVE